MRVRRIKPGHITNCHYCKAQGNKVQASWHLTGENMQACDSHKPLLEDRCARSNALDKRDYSEADHQSWLRL